MKRFTLALLMLASAATSVATARSTTIQVSDVWSRPASGTAVLYATIQNRSGHTDRLIGATSPVAREIELHQSSQSSMSGMSMSNKKMSDMSAMGDMPMGGSMMSMKALDAIPVGPHATTRLAPGGYHLMLDLRRDLKPGETIPVRLHFARAGWIATTAEVKPIH
jgi:copper(I)-binding protein